MSGERSVTIELTPDEVRFIAENWAWGPYEEPEDQILFKVHNAVTVGRRVVKRSAPLRRTGLRRTRPLEPMSAKRRAAIPARRNIREQVFARDRHRCWFADGRYDFVYFAGDCHGPLTPHHLLKASQGGAYTPSNLITLCAFHNGWVEDNPDEAHRLGLVIRRGDTQ